MHEIAELCKGVHCVDLSESFQTHIDLQNLASIQPRTSPLKFAAAPPSRPAAPPFVVDFVDEFRSVKNLSASPTEVGQKFLSENGADRLAANLRGLVLGCIETNFCKKICVRKLSPRSTQCTPLHCSKITFCSKYLLECC